MLPQCNRSSFPLFVRYVSKKYPQIADEFLTTLHFEPPYDNNLLNIPNYFQAYRILSPKVDKKMFVATLISLYAPAAYKQSTHEVNLKRGIGIAIAEALGITKQYSSLLIKEVIIHYKRYDDFRMEVDSIAAKLKGGQDGKSE